LRRRDLHSKVGGSRAARLVLLSSGGSSMKGTVKWFNDSKGYGFIQHTEGDDVFVHFSEIVAEGFRTLHEGDEVQFEVSESEKGSHATNVIHA